MCSKASSIAARVASSGASPGDGMDSSMKIPCPGLIPQVTVGAMSSARIRTTSSYSQPGSEAKPFQLSTAFSQSVPRGE